jgi:transposase
MGWIIAQVGRKTVQLLDTVGKFWIASSEEGHTLETDTGQTGSTAPCRRRNHPCVCIRGISAQFLTEPFVLPRPRFPKATRTSYMTLRDELGIIYEDSAFASLFSSVRGRPAESPGCLALVTALQFAENLSDRQAADAVRSRIDWKYLLGLDLTDPGFDHTLLYEFRNRLLENESERQLLDGLLELLKARKLLRARGKQRTDSTHVLSAIRNLNRLETVGETLRYALESLATLIPDWLKSQVPPEWFDRYSKCFEQWRLPESRAKQQVLAETIGQDGCRLLEMIDQSASMTWLCEIPAIETLRQVWSSSMIYKEIVPAGERGTNCLQDAN